MNVSVARALLPKEHGAYGQVSLPLVTAFGVAGLSAVGVLLASAVVAGFLAHEPAAVVLGFRGARARRTLLQPASQFLAVGLTLACAAAIAAALLMDAQVRWALIVPAVPTALLTMVFVSGREKSWYGELLAALSFSSVAVPVVMAAGLSVNSALAVAVPFAVLFIASTLAVRVVILRVRGRRSPHAEVVTRRAMLAVMTVSVILVGVMIVAGLVETSALIASVPGLLAASFIAVRPPPSTQLRPLGWTLVGVSVLTGLIIVVAQRFS